MQSVPDEVNSVGWFSYGSGWRGVQLPTTEKPLDFCEQLRGTDIALTTQVSMNVVGMVDGCTLFQYTGD